MCWLWNAGGGHGGDSLFVWWLRLLFFRQQGRCLDGESLFTREEGIVLKEGVVSGKDGRCKWANHNFYKFCYYLLYIAQMIFVIKIFYIVFIISGLVGGLEDWRVKGEE